MRSDRSSSQASRRGATGAAWFLLSVLAGLLAGCTAIPPRNVPLDQANSSSGYQFSTVPADNNGLMVALFFSGGGTRAAAFSYGVLRELAATPVPGARRMLDDVSTINAVSGGSFTAAYYCLYGDKIFTDFERDFLKRDVEGALALRCLSPRYTSRLLSGAYGRSDLAAEYYDQILFHGATFGDLAKAGAARPFLVINATNINTSTPVHFTQSQFDLIGSDLNRFPLSRAVAASSAVPLLFTPIILKNYADRAPPVDPSLVPDTNSADIFAGYRAMLRETSSAYRDVEKYPYIHLMDGGLVDNLGLRNLLDTVTLSGGWGTFLELLRKQGINKLAIIVVNAAVETKRDWARSQIVPGSLSVIMALSNSSVLRMDKETEALVEGSLTLWKSQRQAVPAGAPEEPKVYFVRVDLQAVPDAPERAFFAAVPTSLRLPPETVDRLAKAAGRLLREAPAYQELRKDLDAGQPARVASATP
jgi:NTE family protein